ncbi:hypothetical protein H2198_007414 [Neophaeococcomyces mojaviensis]|uniref:Uncharacterized protein n=1 Tax=Neophaeococcomyces mojaviensis TaxID=3383035 RepID=A0ACC3A099_9EURO|nr:hypothetical protein H2198_007414 [Knufia sp. JES_112]
MSVSGILQPPFQQDEALFTSKSPLRQNTLSLVLPVLYQHDDRSFIEIDRARAFECLQYLKFDLNVDRLHKIHKHLWYAGLPHPARTLHHQVMIGREIIITERADLHLVWQGNRLFMKPLPEYLMDYTIWKDFLTLDNAIYEDANGFLLSYMWLICAKSDLKIAHDNGLLSKDITWDRWVTFSTAVIPRLNYRTLHIISPRYIYGELRLGRINTIYRMCSETTNLKTIFRGYQYSYHDYTTFFERNFAWVLTIIIYLTIVLTAMQVGLGTSQLKGSVAFNRASYGFTVFSILAPLIVVAGGVVVVFVLVFVNLNYTLGERSRICTQHPKVFANHRLRDLHPEKRRDGT